MEKYLLVKINGMKEGTQQRRKKSQQLCLKFILWDYSLSSILSKDLCKIDNLQIYRKPMKKLSTYFKQ